jgi:hypothetical protein
VVFPKLAGCKYNPSAVVCACGGATVIRLHYVPACLSPFLATGRHYIIVPTVCLSVRDMRLILFRSKSWNSRGTVPVIVKKVQINKGYRSGIEAYRYAFYAHM